jgi:hypothetical protein
MTANEQLDQIQAELRDATVRMHQIVDPLSDEEWRRRPASGGWSAAQCMEHLNLSSRSYLDPFAHAIEKLKGYGLATPDHYKKSLMGWLIYRSLEPPPKRKYKTAPSFDPQTVVSKEDAVAEWERLQQSVSEFIESSRGLDVCAVRITSPFSPKISYNLFSAFCMIPAHQRRHLWQAERAIKGA